jgi:ribonuclease HI
MNLDQLPNVIIYTDGSCRPNPGIGGWAAILRFGSNEKVLCGSEIDATSNRMELQAAISALQALNQRCLVDLYVDSTYLRKGITEWFPCWRLRNWRANDGHLVQNIDLWKLLDELCHSHKVRWHWIKGHAGNLDNERVNELAHYMLDYEKDPQ